jgi:hypothetical protein
MPNKKPVLLLTTLLASSFAIIGLLAFLSKNGTDKKNGFTRRLTPATLQLQKQATFPVGIYKIIGEQDGRLYFQGNSPYEVYTTTPLLDSLTRIPIAIQPDKKIRKGYQMFLYDHHLYITCRNLPGIIDYNLDTRQSNTQTLPWFYTKEACFAKEQFIFRATDPITKDPVFVKHNMYSAPQRQEDTFSTRNGSSIFPTDGVLYYDAESHRACYTYFYKNGFISMDTSLNLLVTAKTIDTILHREIKIAHVGSSITMNEPPHLVNGSGAVSAGKLYLQSMLKADNELPLDFAENTVIDAYSVTNGNYIASFYIPPYKGDKAFLFNVVGQKLYAIHGKTVIVYNLPI